MGDPAGLDDYREAIDLAIAAGEGKRVAALHNNFGVDRWAVEGPAPAVETLRVMSPSVRARMVPLIGMAQALIADHGGEVPKTMEELHALPGVGRKTANVVLGNAFGINVGVTVDTHVARLSQRLRLTRHDDPVKIERDLMPLFPQADWALLSHLLIFHGRQVCVARRPRCEACVLADLCPSARIP